MEFNVYVLAESSNENPRILTEVNDFFNIKINNLKYAKIYCLKGNLNINQVKFIAEKLLVDPIIEKYHIGDKFLIKQKDYLKVNIWYQPAVLDVVAQNIKKAIKYLGITEDIEVHSGKLLMFKPNKYRNLIQDILKKFFLNELIERYEIL